MVVAIVAGEEGSGKTSQILEIAKRFPVAVYGIMELKDKEKIMGLTSPTFIPEVLFEVYPDGHEKEGNIDPVATVQHVERWRKAVYAMNPPPVIIVLDGVSDLRSEVTDAWIKKDNMERISKGRAPRESIGEKNIGAWGAVNTWVKEIINPLINLGLKKHINVFLTAQMKDKYIDGEIVGIEPALKPYMSYPIPCLFTLSSNESGYKIACTKEPENPRWHVDNVAKNTGFYDALVAHNLIQEPTREKNYMIIYENGGEKHRAFIKAETETEARNEFISVHNACEILEITV
jgi:hypothetical protein